MPPGPFSQVDSQLIADLHSLHAKSPKLLKPIQYAAPVAEEITVESWRMSEFKYYDVPSPFPTLARGLFSVREDEAPEKEKEKDGPTRYRIVARGYDKFFNIGEVPWTAVRFNPFFPLALRHPPPFSYGSAFRPVVVAGNSHKPAIHSDAQVQRMYHLHRCSVSVEASHNIEALRGTRSGRSRESRSGWRALAPLSSRASGKDNGAACAGVMGEELDRGSRGEVDRSPSTDSNV